MANVVSIDGRMTADPEIAEVGVNLTHKCEFRIAVPNAYKRRRNAANDSDFFRVVAWAQLADFVAKYFSKGKWIHITGFLQMHEYEKDGQNRSYVEIVADHVEFVGDKPKDEPAPTGPVQMQPARKQPMRAEDYAALPPDTELPFEV